MKYLTCDYCGKITGINPEYHVNNPYCSVACNIKFKEEGPLPDDMQSRNYCDDLPRFEASLVNWRAKWRGKRRNSSEK